MNPIENVFGNLARAVYKDKPAYLNKRDLIAAIVQEWSNMPQEDLNNIVDSMPKRLYQLIRNRGKSTHY